MEIAGRHSLFFLRENIHTCRIVSVFENKLIISIRGITILFTYAIIFSSFHRRRGKGNVLGKG